MDLKAISDFDGDGVVYRFFGEVSGVNPQLVIVADCDTLQCHITLNPEDLGQFAFHVEQARKELLTLWMQR